MNTFAGTAGGGGRRWDGGAWATLGVVLGLMLFNLVVTSLVLRQLGEGCLVNHPGGLSQIIRECYSARPTPLRPGDELLAAGDISLIGDEGEFWIREQLPEGWGAGATIPYTVRRGSETLILPVPIDPLPWAGIAQQFIFAATTEAESYVLYLGFLAVFLLAPKAWRRGHCSSALGPTSPSVSLAGPVGRCSAQPSFCRGGSRRQPSFSPRFGS